MTNHEHPELDAFTDKDMLDKSQPLSASQEFSFGAADALRVIFGVPVDELRGRTPEQETTDSSRSSTGNQSPGSEAAA